MLDLSYLAVSGFLFGAFLYTGQFTIRYEPEVSLGYATIGLGLAIAVTVNLVIDLLYEGVSHWFRGLTLLSYAVIASGLMLVARQRQKRRRP
jgi:hypothetical protein